MGEEEKKDIIKYSSAKDLKIDFPIPMDAIKVEGEKTQNLIQKEAIYLLNGKTFIGKKALANVLATDSKGANKVYNDLDNSDKLENGDNKYISTPALNKELSKRIEEPRDTIQKERLKNAEASIKSFRDNPDIEKLRELEESKIRKDLPKLKSQKAKAESVDYVTEKPLINTEIHHGERVADNPNRALDKDNLFAVNKDTHKKIHKEGAETVEKLEEFKKKENNS